MNRSNLRKMKRDMRGEDDFRKIINKVAYKWPIENSGKVLVFIHNDPQLKLRLNKMLFPTKISDFNTNIYYTDVDKPNISLTWVTSILHLYSNKVIEYIKLKAEYENCLLNSNFEEAESILNVIEEKISLSSWSLSQRILLGELQFGLEENKKRLEKISKELKNYSLINIILEFNSNASEKNMSYLNYQDKLKKFTETINNTESQQIIRKYLKYKLSLDILNDSFTEHDFSMVFQFENQTSLIDLYNSFLEIIQYLTTNNSALIDKSLINKLSLFTSDFRIRNLHIKYDIPLKEPIHHDFSHIIEAYTKGDYKNIIDKNHLLNHNLLNFQLSQIIVRSYVLNNSLIENDSYLEHFYNIYTINKKYKDSVNSLYLYLKLFKDTVLKWKINYFIKKYIENKQTEFHREMSYLNDFIVTPSFSNILADTQKELFINTLTEYYPYTTSLFLYKNNLGNKQNLFSVDITRRNIIEIKNKLHTLQYDVANNLLNSLSISVDYNNGNYYLLEIKNRLLLNVYIKKPLLLKATEIIVQSYFINKNLIKRFTVADLVNSLKRTRDVNIKKNIIYPILFHINNENDYKFQRIALSNFLDANNIENLEALLNCEDFQKDYLIYLLHKVTTVNNIKRDMRFAKSSEAAESVRIQILHKLIEIDTNNKKIYFEEIHSIMTRQGIKTKMKQINESRIFVDTANIKVENYDILYENYKKYLLMKNFDSEVKGIDISKDDFLLAIGDLMNQRIIADVQFNQEVIILKSIISRITEEFLFNEKYGLDTFLSSRIRHGYINSQLTSLFYEHNLMSKSAKENNDDFTINEYLDENLTHENDESQMLRKTLSDFTRNINKKVLEVKDHWIRIKYSNKHKGVLDFSGFNDYMLLTLDYYLKENTSFDIVFEIIINNLNEYTSQILIDLRLKIINELKDDLINQLNTLEINLNKINSNELEKIGNDIRKNINLCKVKIEGIISEFAETFYLRNLTYVDFNMIDLVSSCREITAKLNKDFNQIKFSQKIEYNPVLKGDYFLYFVDIINVFLNNAIEHSQFSDLGELDISLEISKDNSELLKGLLHQNNIVDSHTEDNIIIKVSNNLNPVLDIDKIQKKVASVFENTKRKEMLKKYTRTEGGSGFYKVVNILTYNLSAAHGIFFELEESKFTLTLVLSIDKISITENVYENINN